MKRLKAKGITIIVFEPSLNEELFFNSRVETNIETFKALCDIIISNRVVEDLQDVAHKVFSRDLFGSD